MKNELLFYDIYPKVVPEGVPVRITIAPRTAHCRFAAQAYRVRAIPMTMEMKGGASAAAQEAVLTPQDGRLVLHMAFGGEQEHSIRVYDETGESCLCKLAIYSLRPDLLAAQPLLGDFHVHTTHSDGLESPDFVAAMYRQAGFDFISITDHSRYFPSLEAIERYRGIPMDFVLYPGEEVHTPGNYVHIINFAADYSVNDLSKEGPGKPARPEWMQEVERLAVLLRDVPQGVDAFVAASCVLAMQKIREGGGMPIFVHPHWISDVYNVPDALSRYILENGYADCFELIGGQSNHENNMQTALWHDLSRHVDIPVVGSSDSHGTADYGAANCGLYDVAKTLVFAKSNSRDDIIAAVKAGFSVAMDDKGPDDVQIYGSYRMVSYAAFLVHHWLPLQRELCFEEGRLMRQFIAGDTDAARQLAGLKGRTAALRQKLFCAPA